MVNLFNDFNFEDIFNPPTKLSFHRPFLENIGYKIKVDEDGNTYLVLNIVGIDEKDLNVSFEPSESNGFLNLVIDGKTHNDALNYDFSVKQIFVIKKPVKKYGQKVENGLLTLKLEFEKPVKPQVEMYKL